MDAETRDREFEISFNAQGYMSQSIRITKEAQALGITPEDLIAAFEDGSACTTCQEGGEVLLVDSKLTDGRLTTVGVVVSNESNCEYDEFESNLAKPLYPDGVCPDCGEEVPSGSVTGEQCSNCEHVWTHIQKVD